MAEKEYIEREAVIELLHYHADETCSAVVADFEAIPAADVATRAEIVEEIFNEIAQMFSEKQQSYEYSHQSGKARQMMVARFEVYKLHQKYKEAHHG